MTPCVSEDGGLRESDLVPGTLHAELVGDLATAVAPHRFESKWPDRYNLKTDVHVSENSGFSPQIIPF